MKTVIYVLILLILLFLLVDFIAALIEVITGKYHIFDKMDTIISRIVIGLVALGLGAFLILGIIATIKELIHG